MMMCSCVCGQQ